MNNISSFLFSISIPICAAWIAAIKAKVDIDWTVVLLALIGGIPGTIMALAAWRAAKNAHIESMEAKSEAEQAKLETKETSKNVDGRLTKFLAETKSDAQKLLKVSTDAAFAEGVKEGKDSTSTSKAKQH